METYTGEEVRKQKLRVERAIERGTPELRTRLWGAGVQVTLGPGPAGAGAAGGARGSAAGAAVAWAMFAGTASIGAGRECESPDSVRGRPHAGPGKGSEAPQVTWVALARAVFGCGLGSTAGRGRCCKLLVKLLVKLFVRLLGETIGEAVGEIGEAAGEP